MVSLLEVSTVRDTGGVRETGGWETGGWVGTELVNVHMQDPSLGNL